MTKEDFVNLVSSELDKLRQEEQVISSKIEILQREGKEGKLEEEKYQLSLTRYKLDAIGKLVDLPIYFGIQYMSNEEIKDYQNKMIQDLDSEILAIKLKEESDKDNINLIRKEQERLLCSYITSSETEQKKAIDRYGELQEILRVLESNNLLDEGKRRIEEIQGKKKKIELKTTQEMKEKLLSERIDNRQDLEKIIVDIEERSCDADKMMALIGKDAKKTYLAKSKLDEYYKLETKQKFLTSKFDFDTELPVTLQKFILDNFEDEFKHGIVRNPKLIRNCILNFKRSYFDFYREEFKDNFKEELLGGLIDCDFNFGSDVDFEFLDRHHFHYLSSDIDVLKSLVEKRNRKTNRLIQRIASFSRPVLIDSKIINLQRTIYKNLIDWYKSKFSDEKSREKNRETYQDILGLTKGITFEGSNRKQLKEELDLCYSEISATEEKIKTLCERLQDAQDQLEKEKYKLEVQKVQITNEITNLAFGNDEKGEQNSEDGAVIEMSYCGDLQDFLEAAGRDYVKEIVNKVKQEAVNQANMKEAELKKITLEELLKQKEESESQYVDPVDVFLGKTKKRLLK